MIRNFLPRLVFFVLGIVAVAPIVVAESIQLVISGEPYPLKAFRSNDVDYFSFSEVAEQLGGKLDWSILGHQVTYSGDNNRFDFWLGSPFFRLNDRIYNNTFPAEIRDGQLFLPAQTFVPFLDGAQPQKISFDKDRRVLRIDSQFYNVVDLVLKEKANGLLIEILLTSALRYEAYVTEGDWLNVNITDGRLDRTQISTRQDRRYMYKLSTHQATGSAQVSMRLRRPIKNWHHKLAYDPPRIQISIADVDFSLDQVDTTPKVVGPDDKIDVIVIDPGHGGKDYGAVGPGKTREKDIVLGIGRELAKLLRDDKQFKVIMTRDRDRAVSLDKRAKIANSAGADLFISIHANASPKRSPNGWNVFFLAPALNDSARAVAQFENSVFMREMLDPDETEDTTDSDPVLGILNEMIMTEFQEESHDFALMIAKEFRRKLKTRSRGVDQAGFFVLNKVFTPSVLIESGFISNKKEEKTLKSSKYQKSVAEALYAAIKRFKGKYEASK